MAYNTNISDEEYIDAITNSVSYAEAARKLNASYTAVRLASVRLALTTKRGYTHKVDSKEINAEYVRSMYLSNKIAISSSHLRQLLLKTEIKEHRCELCLLSEWLDSPIPLELHHINGNHNDNTEFNLMLVCPTCHAYITHNLSEREEQKQLKEAEKKIKEEQKAYYDKHGWPPELIRGKKLHCTADDLIKLFNEHGSFTAVGKVLGVTDKAIKQRCKKLGILDIVTPISYANRANIIKQHQKPLTNEQRAERSRIRQLKNGEIRHIGQYDKDGTLIKIYDYLYEAVSDGFNRSHIRECCNGKRASHKGFIWKFVD